MPPLAAQYLRSLALSPAETDRRQLADTAGTTADFLTKANFSTTASRRYLHLIPLITTTATAVPGNIGKGWKIDPDTMGATATINRVIPAGVWTFETAMSATVAQIAADTKLQAVVSRVNGVTGIGTVLFSSVSAAFQLLTIASAHTWDSASQPEFVMGLDDTIIVEMFVESIGVTIVGQTLSFGVEAPEGAGAAADSKAIMPGDITSRYLTSYTGGVSSTGVKSFGPTQGVTLKRGGTVSPGPGVTPRQPRLIRLGLVTPAGVSIKQSRTQHEGVMTPAAQVLKRPIHFISGLITPGPGSVPRQIRLIRLGTITPASVVQRFLSRFHTGSITPTATAWKQYRPLPKSGQIALVGGLIKRPGKLVTAVITPVGTMGALLRKNFLGAIASVGTVAKGLFKDLSGTITSSASNWKQPQYRHEGFFYATGSSDWPLTTPTKTISGVVRDSQGEPVAGALVKLVRGADDFVAGTAVSGVDGAYSFVRDAVDPNTYYVTAFEEEGTPTQGMSERGLVPF